MDHRREELYTELSEQIGNTPLVQLDAYIPNGHSIWIKRECDNPFGSHYDRVYLALFKQFESLGKIFPGSRVIETTSGAAGVSFAGIGKVLGFECHVALPAGGEVAREDAIKKELKDSDRLILTPESEYTAGFPKFIKQFLQENPEFVFLNHSMGRRLQNNAVTLDALAKIAEEVNECLTPDVFIPAIGNGSSVLGPGMVFRREWGEQIQMYGFESVQSAVTYDLMFPGSYKQVFSIEPGTLSRHRMPGTSFQGIDFPHIRGAVNEGILDGVFLVSSSQLDAEYIAITGTNKTQALAHWDQFTHEDLGRTGRASIAVAYHHAQQLGENKNIIVIAYDKAERYDS
jgi:cysteine synthase